MTVKSFRKTFLHSLKKEYPTQELQAFLNIIFEQLKGWTKIQIILNEDRQLSESELSDLQEITERIEKHEPLQYILGFTEFHGLKIGLNPSVLIPRPETEELILYIENNFRKDQDLSIIDLGTGSGCIALSLARYFSRAKIYACDFSEKALQTAQKTADALQLKLNFFQDDILNFQNSIPTETYDLIVSNPPYVRESEKKMMEKNVLNYEPAEALFVSDETPLLFYTALADIANRHLASGGTIIMEINEYLAKETADLFESKGFKNIEIIKDIFDKNRFIKAGK